MIPKPINEITNIKALKKIYELSYKNVMEIVSEKIENPMFGMPLSVEVDETNFIDISSYNKFSIVRRNSPLNPYSNPIVQPFNIKLMVF